MEIASAQGVLALAFDAIESLPTNYRPEMGKLMDWLGDTSFIESTNENYLNNVSSIAKSLNDEGIRVVVLKGLACSKWYPNPNHRNRGDFDCYLCCDFEKGNEVFVRLGGKLDPCCYKHSEVSFRDVIVENHRFFLNIRGNKNMKILERHLQHLVIERPVSEREYFEGRAWKCHVHTSMPCF